MAIEDKKFQAIKVEKEDGITWLYFNRPEKRNALSPTLQREMYEALLDLEDDPETKVLVLTGTGVSFSAGMDIREFFRPRYNLPPERRAQGRFDWSWNLLSTFPAPTIAMVNGYCFGAALTPMVSCDIAIAAEDAIFGVSEVNWGVIAGGMVSKSLTDALSYRDAIFYTMTGRPFDGKKAAELRFVNMAVPREQLREETVKLARELMEKSPYVLRACKEAIRFVRNMDASEAREYLAVKGTALRLGDPLKFQETGMTEFLDKKSYRPGFGTVKQKA